MSDNVIFKVGTLNNDGSLKNTPSSKKGQLLFGINNDSTGLIYYDNGTKKIPMNFSANKLTTARTISLTGDVSGFTTFDGHENASIIATVNYDSHSHSFSTILRDNGNWAGRVAPIDYGLINTVRACRTAFTPADAIKVEYSTDGSTWVDYGLSNEEKRKLFLNKSEGAFQVDLGKTGDAAINKAVRITIEPIDRYATVDTFYCWFNTQGHTCVCTIEVSTKGAQDTFTVIKKNVPISGWSGPNEITFQELAYGGFTSQNNNNYKFRFTFKITKVGSNTAYLSALPRVTDLRLYGDSVAIRANNMMDIDHIYNWDVDQNAIFPAQVKATSFLGNASSADKLKTVRTINGTNFDGSANITTSFWGTARNISIVSSDGTGAGTAVSVNGSGNVSLKLPATIKANLTGKATSAGTADTATTTTGNAGTATTLQTARNFSIASTAASGSVSFNGSADVALKIPQTLTGFTNITSTTFTGALSGNASSANKVNSALSINVNGTTTSFDGSVAKSITINAASLGLDSVMDFLGTTTTAISDGSTTTSIKIGENTITANKGDVVLYSGKEFVFTGTAWELLGDEGSYALKTITITAGNGLTGGGTLAANRTLSVGQGSGITVTADAVAHADTSNQSSITAASRTYISGITLDGFGHVTGLTTGKETVVDTNTAHSHGAGTGLTISGSGGTSGTTTYSANLNSTTSLGTIGTTSKLYAVGVDENGKLCVNVPWINTTYSAGTGLSLSGTTLNHSNSITAGSVGSAQSPSYGGTFAIPKITYDAQGHITGATTVNITLPKANNVNINGTAFNGTTGITTANWGTARTLTIGNKGVSVNGSTNYSWPLHDILWNSTIGTADSWNIFVPGVYSTGASSFTGAGNPNNTIGASAGMYGYGQLIICRAADQGVAQFYISHHDSGTDGRNGIKFRTGYANTYFDTWRMILDSVNYSNFAVKKTGDTMTGDLLISADSYPSVKLCPNGMNSLAVIEGSVDNSASISSWNDSTGKNRRMLEVYNSLKTSKLDEAVMLRTGINGTFYKYRVFHSGMETPIPVNNGGTGLTTWEAIRSHVGLYYGFEELGIQSDKTWLEDIWSKMWSSATGGQGRVTVDAAAVYGAPTQWGQIEIMKINGWQGVAKCFGYATNTFWIATRNGTNGWHGWMEYKTTTMVNPGEINVPTSSIS